tara:strand:+ start:915 stop:1388 length:474 start_codon:yes stop_codon:yes gene_type:complete
MSELNIHYVDPEEDYKYIEQAYNLAKEENIGITRDREVVNVVLDDNDNVIATTFDAWDFETFEFDVVVSKKEQGKKIGTQLTELAIERFEDYKQMNENAIIKLFVVNDNMKKILEKRNFEVTQKMQDSYIMSPKNEIIDYLNNRDQKVVTKKKNKLT